MKYKSALREGLRETLLKLLREKSYDDISVTELCKTAGVSRTGFYRSYGTKESIIRDIIERLIADFGVKAGHFIDSPYDNKTGWYAEYFKVLLENSEIYFTLYDAGFGTEYLAKTNEILIKRAGGDKEKEALILIWNGALFNISREWLYHREKASIQLMAELCGAMMPK